MTSPDAAGGLWVRGGAASSKAAAKERPADERAAERKRPILCRRCGEELSDGSAVFAMTSGGSSEVFVNPHGVLHEVVTVHWARNLIVAGPPTTEFTWYPGYAWEIAYCARCREHSGWAFTAVAGGAPSRFWALRRVAIVEGGSG